MRNMLGLSFFYFILLPLSYAGVSETVEKIVRPVVNVTENSRPAIDPGKVSKPAHPIDPFVEKLQRKRAKFMREQLEERREYFKKIRKKDLERKERQEKLAKFNQKEREELQEFMSEQKEKLDKHYEGEDESIWNKLF